MNADMPNWIVASTSRRKPSSKSPSSDHGRVGLEKIRFSLSNLSQLFECRLAMVRSPPLLYNVDRSPWG